MGDTKELTGRALDEAVHVEVMCKCVHQWDDPPGMLFDGVTTGCRNFTCQQCGLAEHACNQKSPTDYIPAYSVEIGPSWLVVEEMRCRGLRFTLEELDCPPQWAATFGALSAVDGYAVPEHWIELGATAPEAIARAALVAVRGAQGEEAKPG